MNCTEKTWNLPSLRAFRIGVEASQQACPGPNGIGGIAVHLSNLFISIPRYWVWLLSLQGLVEFSIGASLGHWEIVAGHWVCCNRAINATEGRGDCSRYIFGSSHICLFPGPGHLCRSSHCFVTNSTWSQANITSDEWYPTGLYVIAVSTPRCIPWRFYFCKNSSKLCFGSHSVQCFCPQDVQDTHSKKYTLNFFSAGFRSWQLQIFSSHGDPDWSYSWSHGVLSSSPIRSRNW